VNSEVKEAEGYAIVLKVTVKFALEQATKFRRGSRSIDLLFL